MTGSKFNVQGSKSDVRQRLASVDPEGSRINYPTL